MKTKMKTKLLAILMSMAMVFTMMPMIGGAAYADDPAPAAPGIAIGPDVLSVGSNTSEAATVHMAGTKWHVIGYGASQEGGITQVASSADTMTLIAANNLNTAVQFNPGNNQVNTYKDSNLYNEVNALTDDTNGIFSKGEKEGIVARDLEPGGYTDQSPYTNGIAGDKVENALLWPLSTQEAYYMNSEFRRASYIWWLRSPGDKTNRVAAVTGMSAVVVFGFNVDLNYGRRPAFNFNLDSVILTSAAEGGKSSGDVGAGSLKSIEPNSNNEWKLTLESGHEGFKITSSSYDNTNHVLTVYYSGAVTSPDGNEYVSAVVVDKDSKITHYGNIKQCKSDGDASGQIEINLGGVLSCENDTKVYVFNEQLNGDKKTDYSSALSEITIPSPTDHTWSIEWSKDGENHWHECSACGEKKDEVAHTWNTEWSTDGDKHWHDCTVCGEKKDETAHSGGTATCKDKAKCETCNEEYGNLGQHKYGTWIKLNATQHQKVCQHDKSHVVKENHKWDAGKVTKKATEKQAGVKTYTCTVCKATKTEVIPKLKPTTPKTSGTPLAKATVKKKSMTIGWNKIQGASGYDIFFAQCDHSGKKIACKKVKTIKGNKTFKWTKSGLKKGTAYKFYVRAYITKNGKKTYVSKTPMFHAYTGNGTKNFTNAKSVTVKKTKVTLKKGKTFKIKAKVNKVNKKKKLMPKSHAPTLRYMTTNKKVATVTKSGKITAKGKGKCTVIAFAHNGVSKSIKVTVK